MWLLMTIGFLGFVCWQLGGCARKKQRYFDTLNLGIRVSKKVPVNRAMEKTLVISSI